MAENRSVVYEAPRHTPVIGTYDLVVLGGGPSGVAAAHRANACGLRVALVEGYGFLGGMATAASVSNFCGLHAGSSSAPKQLVHGFADLVLDGLRSHRALGDARSVLGRTHAIAYDPAVYRYVLDTLTAHRGVDVHLHAMAVGCTVASSRIDALLIETKEGRAALRARFFVDASGDADLAKWAGVRVVNGFDDGFLAFPTLMFRVGNVDAQTALTQGKPNMRELIAEHVRQGGTKPPRDAIYINPQPNSAEWRINATQIDWQGGPLDATQHDHLRHAEFEGRRQMMSFFEFLRRCVPGFAQAYLLDVAPQVGVRETRRLVGAYVLTREDILGCGRFHDSIGVSAWPVERHVRGDVEWAWLPEGTYHEIPYRSLLANEVDNLLVTGRCASATQDAQAAIRVSGPCFQMGEAAGAATAVAMHASCDRYRDLPIGPLQKLLRECGVNIGEKP